METILLVVHVLLSIAIIGLVMIQRGKGAEAGAALGGGASGTVFGARGAANFLSRTTAVLAALFIVNSLVLASLAAGHKAPGSVTESVVTEQAEAKPATAVDDMGSDLPPVEMPAESTGDMPQAPTESAGDVPSLPAEPAKGDDVPAAE